MPPRRTGRGGRLLRARPRLLLTLGLAFLLVWGMGAASRRGGESAPAGPDPYADLTGREIYQRVLDNRFASYIQESTLISGDRGGNDQKTRLRMWFQSYRDDAGAPTDGDTLSKTRVEYTHPFDIRHANYLVIKRLDHPSDQFVYLPTNRRVRRVNLRGEAVFGTDFSFEDVIPREVEDADYLRLPDQVVDGVDCFAIEVTPKPRMHSEYSRFLIHVEKARFVPLRSQYWDDRGVEVKELQVDHDSIEKVDDVWIPMRMTMRNLRLESYTSLVVGEIEPNPDIERTVFDLRRLESH
jgi:hypothetical protein